MTRAVAWHLRRFVLGTSQIRVVGLTLLEGLLLAVVSCAPAAARSQEGRNLAVAAASDLQSAFEDIGRLYEQDMGVRVIFSFGSSRNLATQIENGAPLDLFASADEEYTRELSDRGVTVVGTERTYAHGHLALVYFRGSGLQPQRLEDLAGPDVRRIAIANPQHAPYGQAAWEALTAAGLWEPLRPRLVYGENVRQALQFVQTGNADAGLVALSIADVPEVGRVAVAGALYRPLHQTLAVVKGTRREDLARQFAAFITGAKGQAVLQRYGFDPPDGQ